MKEIQYWIAKAIGKLGRNEIEHMSKYFRKSGMKIGCGCNICSNIMTNEPFLVEIRDSVTISGNVVLVTHDNSIERIDRKCHNLFGKIIIGNNCFIGMNSMILYGVELADNIIVAAGSVVVNSFDESNIIIAGNPARKIGTWQDFIDKNKPYALGRGYREKIEENPELLIRKKVKK